MIKALAVAALFSTLSALAQEPGSTAENPVHNELRKTRGEVIEAIESRDLDRMLAHVHPDVVVTWQNGETCHGLAELRAFYQRMGKDAFVSFKVPHEVDRLSVIHGGHTAIAAGHVVADYQLLGKSYEFDSRWTATLVLENGQWLIAAYHISLNALDNPILDTAKSSLWLAAGAGLVSGLLSALLISRLRSKS
jgi:ketosteroid isomerase-like protein